MKWSASLICSDLFNLQKDIHVLQTSHVEFLHIDVMDGLFVPRFGMYPEMVQKIKEACLIPIEVHLMVQHPEPYIPVFRKAGADIITVHLEACRSHLVRTLEMIHVTGAAAGIALNPGTDLEGEEYVIDMIDYLEIMGINPGIIGQTLKPTTIDKIKKYRSLFHFKKHKISLIIDGGVNFANYLALFEAGADILVGGSQTIFRSQHAITENLMQLRNMNLEGV